MEIRLPVFPGAKLFTVGKINVREMDRLAKDDELMQIETKKGNRSIKAPADGIVRRLLVQEGDQVSAGDPLAEFEEGDAHSRTAQGDSAEGASRETAQIEEKEADLLILGGGIGGYVSAILASRNGRRPVLVERGRMGGTCLNVGCIPTKAFIASAEHAEALRECGLFGVDCSPAFTVNMEKLVERKDRVVDRLVGGVEYLMEKNRIELIKGSASFTDDAHVLVSGEKNLRLHFRDCIIATGSAVSLPPIPGIRLAGVMDSTEALSCKELPGSIVIIGGGVIGLEFAFLYRSLGAEVTVAEFLDRLLPMMDSDVSEEILRSARAKGIRVELGAEVTEFMKAENGQLITAYRKGGNRHYLTSGRVLVAIGRHAETEGLGLENTTIQLLEKGRGIRTDEHMQTSAAHIYAVGDVNNRVQLAHAASYEAEIAVDHICGRERAFDRNVIPSVIFTRPEIASVGLTEDMARAQGIPCKTSVFHYAANGKALTMNAPEGYVKLLANEENEILGGTVIGADASALIATITLAVTKRMKAEALQETVFAHPTTAEIVHEAALGLTIGALHE